MTEDQMRAGAAEMLEAIGKRKGAMYRSTCTAILNLKGIHFLLTTAGEELEDESRQVILSLLQGTVMNLCLATGYNLEEMLTDITPITKRFFG